VKSEFMMIVPFAMTIFHKITKSAKLVILLIIPTYAKVSNESLNPIFAQLVISLNLVLAGLRLGLKNRQVSEKWVSDDCSYLCTKVSKKNPLFIKKAKNALFCFCSLDKYQNAE
jgi:hypothetical protein